MKARIVTLLLMLSLGVKAQDVQLRPWEVYLNEVMTLEDVESASLETVYDLLCELEQHPLDINSLTRETLEQFPFLSAQQIEEIIEYRDRYGPLKSVGELQMVRSLDYAQRRLLSYFIYIGDEQERGFPKLDDIARYGRHELMATARIPFYRRKGDDGTYLGDPYRHWLRYQFTYHDAVKAGFVGAKDAGEPFFTGRNRWGYDHYAFYLQLRGLGRLESLCLGHYRISMGMGLVMNSDFSLGKVAMLQNLGRASTGLRAHSSRSDNFLQGAAATLNLGKGLRLTAFGSYRAIDATLNKDGTAATLLNTGYHRTAAEMDKKHNLNMMKAGGSLSYQYGGLHIGLNMAYSQLSRELKPNTSALYRKNYPQGKDFLNTSLDYRYASHRLSLSGETAIDKAVTAAGGREIYTLEVYVRSIPMEKGFALKQDFKHLNPFECGLGWSVDLEKEFIGKEATLAIRENPRYQMVGLVFDWESTEDISIWERVYLYGVEVGRCAQAIYGYTVDKNIGFATIRAGIPEGTRVTVGPNGSPATVVSKVFC